GTHETTPAVVLVRRAQAPILPERCLGWSRRPASDTAQPTKRARHSRHDPRILVSNMPFGFGLPEEPEGEGESGKKKGGGGQGPADNPLAAMFGALGPGGAMNPQDLGAAFQQLGQML